MEVTTAVFAVIIGYLSGSISFSRIIAKIVNPKADISNVRLDGSHGDAAFESNSVSATSVRKNLGAKYGCLTALLDMGKVFTPTLIFKLLYVNDPYFLFVATFGIVGHNYPVFHRFRGGRGESAIFGGFLAIDWIGFFATNLLGMVTGMLLGQVVIFRWAVHFIMIPWLWFRTHDLYHLFYILLANALYWIAMIPEVSQYFKLLKAGQEPGEEEFSTMMGMGPKLGRFINDYNIFTLTKKIFNR